MSAVPCLVVPPLCRRLLATACLLSIVGTGAPASADDRMLVPRRSFERLVTSNGHLVASYDRVSRRVDTLLEHPYRFAQPRLPDDDRCFGADETRDLAFDLYFGVRSTSGGVARGEWLAELPLDGTEVEHGTNVLVARQHAGAGRALAVETRVLAPYTLDAPVLLMTLSVENASDAPVEVAPYFLANLHLGAAEGRREPSAAREQVVWDDARRAFYEYSDDSRGTAAYVPLSPIQHVTASTGAAGAYESLRALRDLDGVGGTSGPTDDVAPGLQGATVTLAPGARTAMAVAIVWALDEDAGPKVDAVRTWAGARGVDELLAREREAWAAWHAEGTAPPELHDETALLRQGQVREPGPGFGQILASLPPGLGNVEATWNIAWVRDMAYATAALARTGHLREARDALRFQVEAPRGLYEDYVGRPYRISITRYFGNGAEESDCNADGPNIEFDGFGLFLWSLGEYVRAGGDVEVVRGWWPVIESEIADVLISLIGPDGVILPDSSIWEVHWNGKQRRFTYTSLAAARGLCDASDVASMLGETEDAARFRSAGAGVRDAVVARHTDRRGVLAQSAEDLARGYGYLDAAAVEAIAWGIVDPDGRVAHATRAALRENLTVAHGRGLMRNDDGGWYDSQEWVFVDLRLAAAERGLPEARALLDWVRGQAEQNDFSISELHDPINGEYRGSVPMVGFGAGAYALAELVGRNAPACGAYAPEPTPPPPLDAGSPADAGADGEPTGPPACVGEGCTPAPSGCGCVAAGAASPPSRWAPALLAALGLLGLLHLWPRRRRRLRLPPGAPNGHPQRAPAKTPGLSVLGAVACASGVWLTAGALVGCGDDDGTMPPADGGPSRDGGPPTGPRCEVEITYRDTASTPRVFIAGSWNGFSTEAEELLDDGTGTYRRISWLPPGLHAYKFYVVGDGREPWRLDPGNPYRVYEGGIENSGLRVADCRLPGLRVVATNTPGGSRADGTFEAQLRYEPRAAGPLLRVSGELRSGLEVRSLTADELRVSASDRIDVRLTGLPTGKHTVSVTATSTSGTVSENAVMPFWIEAERFRWNDALIYMILTDRYRNGDPSNDGMRTDASRGADWFGGDLQGVTQSLEDGSITDLGVNALWLTPFYTNPTGTYVAADEIHRVTGYHGYWPVAPLTVDPRLGGEEALRRMVAAAHARGVRVLMDLVANHVHEEHPYYREHRDWFSDGCVCGTFGCDWTERRLDCLFRPYMPDIDWTKPAAQERFLEDALVWMERFDLDGFRVDAVKHVPDSAIIDLAVRVRERFETAGTRVFLMGETAMGWDPGAGPSEGGNVANYDTISRYIGPYALDGQFDFPLYYAAALQFLREEPGRGMAHIEYWTRASQWRYPPGAVMTPYIGSHDVPRFLSLASDPVRAGHQWDDLPGTPDSDEPYDRMYVALGWLMSLPGAPLLYYGDEYGEPGGADPDNRRPWRRGTQLNARETRQLERVAALGRGRRSLRGLRSDAWRTLFVDEERWLVARGTGEDLVLVAIHRGASPTTLEVAIPRDVAAEGTVFTDELQPATRATVRRAAISIPMPPRSVRYLYRRR